MEALRRGGIFTLVTFVWALFIFCEQYVFMLENGQNSYVSLPSKETLRVAAPPTPASRRRDLCGPAHWRSHTRCVLCRLIRNCVSHPPPPCKPVTPRPVSHRTMERAFIQPTPRCWDLGSFQWSS